MNDLPNVIAKLFNEDGLNGNQLTVTGDQNVQLKTNLGIMVAQIPYFYKKEKIYFLLM